MNPIILTSEARAGILATILFTHSLVLPLVEDVMDTVNELFPGLTKIVKNSDTDPGVWESELLNAMKTRPKVRVRFYRDKASHRAWVIDLDLFDLEITRTKSYDPDHPGDIASPEGTGGFWRLIDQEVVNRTSENGGTVLLAAFVRSRDFIGSITDAMIRK